MTIDDDDEEEKTENKTNHEYVTQLLSNSSLMIYQRHGRTSTRDYRR
jgi:hypothetical protein